MSQETQSGWAGPLQGIRVVDLTRVLAGPFATQSLGDLGAEILKIEPPGGGDETRRFPPFIAGESHYFLGINRNKKSLVIDLSQGAGADILRRLVARADILVENYRPGVMDRLGLGYEALAALNPRLIYCAISGFGLTGPLSDKPSFDIVTQALTGALSINGERGHMPVKLGIPLGDMVGGVFGPMAILAALHERTQTGRGRLIDISLYDGLIGMLGYFAQLAFITGEDPPPMGSSHPNIVPYGSFPASDGSIIIAVLSESFWGKLCDALERPDLGRGPALCDPEPQARPARRGRSPHRRSHPHPHRRRVAGAADALRRSACTGARGHRRAGAPACASARDGGDRAARDGRPSAAGRTADQVSRFTAVSFDRAADPGSAYRPGLARRTRLQRG